MADEIPLTKTKPAVGFSGLTFAFSAIHRMDIKILPDCMSPGHPKSCDNKIETLKSQLHLYS